MDKETKSYWPWILLIIIVIFGLYLRVYHYDYPVIGYHNWKETHYLSEARNFAREGFFAHGFFVPTYDYPSLSQNPSGAHADTFPIISIIVAILFKIFGVNLGMARLVGIFFNTATIPLVYLAVKKLFPEREDIALSSAFLTAMMPLLVFFSHNVQLMNVGIFFMVLALYFFLRWKESFKGWHFVLATFSLTLATLTKYPFLTILIPIFFIFPFDRLKTNWRQDLKVYLVSLLIFSAFPMWWYYVNEIVAQEAHSRGSGRLSSIQPHKILEPRWMESMTAYVRDNYTMLGFFLAFLGLLCLLFFLVKNKLKVSMGERFLFGYFIGGVVFLFTMAAKLSGHSYHQYVVAPLIALLISYLGIKIGDFLKNLNVEGKSIPFINFVIIAIILGALFLPMRESASRQFDTQFYGLDIAGEYIKENKEPGDRVIHSSHQAFGILWHGDMKGSRGIPDTVESMKFLEENRSSPWLFIYYWDFGEVMQNEELWGYIKDNYELKQFAFLQTEQVQPVYMLFKKGGTFDDSQLNNMLMGKPVQHKDYELTGGKVRLSYITL